ncbi:MAG: DUF2249 domain-containing protein [Bacteriovorax sp.]|jgi:uncharacterized protein (DUF2249 family)|nr:DUF2249 domain-containing protein [Bacteriovorax sp.]
MKEVMIEAQSIPAPERHNTIFKAFDNLEAGESIIIVNNHDPLPLLMQFEEQRPSQFAVSYLEKGPVSWQVKIAKKMKEGCCGCC